MKYRCRLTITAVCLTAAFFTASAPVRSFAAEVSSSAALESGMETAPEETVETASEETVETTAEAMTEETMEETIFLGLRKTAGITEEEFYRQCGKELMDVYREPVEKMERLGMLAREGGRIFLTEQGLDVSNAVFVEFML